MKILNAIGDWNPQLVREWQGRFQPWNVVAAFCLSIVGQFTFLSVRFASLPATYSQTHRYCAGKGANPLCLKNNWGQPLINWQVWWHDNFSHLTRCILTVLIVGGVYLLISNLIYEERRGTLNFVRLSPRTNHDIVLGKLLGVPTLLYVALATALPLHLWAAVQGQIPWTHVLGTYGAGFASCAFFFSGALLWGLTTTVFGNLQPWVGAGFIATIVSTLTSIDVSQYVSPDLAWMMAFSPMVLIEKPHYDSTWFGLPYLGGVSFLTLFKVGFFGIWTAWVWEALDRRFRNANTTVLSKLQSYGFTACLVGSLVGFSWGLSANYTSTLFFGISFFMSLVVAMLITPNRQTLQEWARYRRSAAKRQPLVRDLLLGEKSPALLAIALNMAIVVAILASTVATTEILDTLTLGGSVLVLAAIFQMMLMSRTSNPALWAISLMGVLVFVPLFVAAAFSNTNSAVWLLTAMPWIGEDAVLLYMGFMGQMLAVAICALRLNRQLKRLGASASRELMQGVG
jgi:hypothetical protein